MKIYSVCTATARDAFLRIQQVIIYHLFFSLFMFTPADVKLPRISKSHTGYLNCQKLFNGIKNSHEIMALRSEKFKFIARGIFFWNWIFVIRVLIIISMMLGSLLVQNFELMPKLKIGMPLTTILYIKIKACRKCIMRIPSYAIFIYSISTIL